MILTKILLGTQEEAAEAYDIAAIKFRGLNAVTNFDMSRYDVKSIATSNLPIGGMSTAKAKLSSSPDAAHSLSADTKSAASIATTTTTTTDIDRDLSSAASSASTLSFAIPIKQDPSPDYWSNIFCFQNPNNNNNNSNALSLNPITVAKNPSSAFNVDFSSTSTISHQVASNANNVGGFFGYANHHHQQPETVPFAMPIGGAVNSNNNNNNNGNYETSSNGYNNNINGIGWNNIGPTLHTFHHHHHQTHAKPSTLFHQTPIFGIE